MGPRRDGHLRQGGDSHGGLGGRPGAEGDGGGRQSAATAGVAPRHNLCLEQKLAKFAKADPKGRTDSFRERETGGPWPTHGFAAKARLPVIRPETDGPVGQGFRIR